MDTHRRKTLMALLVALALVFTGCGGDDDTSATTAGPVADDSPLAETSTTEAVTTTEATTTTVAVFDVNAAVASYVATIPEGWMAVSDITAFKDAVDAGGALVIDVRETGEYADGHIMDAINIPIRTLGENVDKIPTDQPVFVYCKSGWRAGMATSSLRMMGFDNVLAFPPGWDGWTAAGEAVSSGSVEIETVGDPGFAPELVAAVNDFLTTIPDGFLTAGDAAAVSDAIDNGAFMLDVREPSEYAEGYIPTAMNAAVRTLAITDVEIPTDTNVVVYCKSGYRASLAVPILHVLGYDNVKGFSGSWLAWTGADLPVEMVDA